MALSNCPKCWNTPCNCGWEYRDYSIEALDWHIKMFSTIKEYKETHPHATFSSYWSGGEETENDGELILMLNKLYVKTIYELEERRNYD